MEQFLNNLIASVITAAISFGIYFLIKKMISKILSAGLKKAKHRKSLTIMKVINNILKAIIIVLCSCYFNYSSFLGNRY